LHGNTSYLAKNINQTMSALNPLEWNQLQSSKADLRSLTTNNIKEFPREVTMDEVRAHSDEKLGAWMVVKGKCYAASAYLPYHPGGINEILRGAGKDATSLFEEYHKWVNADAMLKKCFIGPVVKSSSLLLQATTTTTATKHDEQYNPTTKWPDLDSWTRVNYLGVLHSNIMLGKNCCFVRISSPGLYRPRDCVWHIELRVVIGGRMIEREYTPIMNVKFWGMNENLSIVEHSEENEPLTLFIKYYNERRKMSWTLSNHQTTTTTTSSSTPLLMEVKLYFKLFHDWKKFTRIGMICIGTAITPMLQILTNEFLFDSTEQSHQREFWLVWGNATEESISFRPALAKLEERFHERFHVTHVIEANKEIISGIYNDNIITGKRIDSDLIPTLQEKNSLPSHHDDHVGILYCGTWEFERCIRSALFLNGYETSQVIKMN
jgi:cytochrome b involved in lipid metabolism